jgi:small GTP-binding protein
MGRGGGAGGCGARPRGRGSQPSAWQRTRSPTDSREKKLRERHYTMPAGTSSDDYHFSFSLAVLGDARTGKSKLINCTLPEASSAEEEAGAAELGVDHGVRCKAHTYESRGARYQILMWEVPGAPRYLDAAARYASMAAGLLLVFDLTRRSTFERIPLWLEAVDATSPELPRVLVGNKSDGETQVSAEEAVALAQQHGCKCTHAHAPPARRPLALTNAH